MLWASSIEKNLFKGWLNSNQSWNFLQAQFLAVPGRFHRHDHHLLALSMTCCPRASDFCSVFRGYVLIQHPLNSKNLETKNLETPENFVNEENLLAQLGVSRVVTAAIGCGARDRRDTVRLKHASIGDWWRRGQ